MLQKSSMLQTAGVFFINPHKEYYLTDISKEIKLAHTSVKRNLKKLAKLGLIKEYIKRKGKRKFPFYKANTENKIFSRYKTIYNISSILESDLIDYIEKELNPKSIVLFGSYQRGEDSEDSDIDLFVECKEEQLDLKVFEKRFRRKIQLHFKENFISYPKELKNNIINGIVLSGFLEGYK